jgi:alpha-glucosidase (family GH31 glycosyl hydrolase)
MIGDALLAAPLYGNDYEAATARDIYLPRGQWMDYDTGQTYQGPTLLRSFKLPTGKTPLFAGGSGIVEEKRGREIVARIYPVSTEAQSFFIDRNGVTRTSIRVHVADWKNVTATARGGRKIAAALARHAFEFVIEPGESYEVH